MAFVIDDAAIATAGEVTSEASSEVGESIAEGCASESELSAEFSENAFSSNNTEGCEDCDAVIEDSVEQGTDPQSLEEEFSLESIEKNTDKSSSEELETQPDNVERTSSFEDQTVDNFELEERRPQIEDKLNLGQPHDADVLRANMEVAMDKQTDKTVSRAHHIVGNETPNAAKKLEEVGIDRNDAANGILLPNDASSPLKGSIHSGRHLQEYYNTVEQRMAQATTREEVLEVLQSLKEDLYSGDLPLQRDVQPNK